MLAEMLLRLWKSRQEPMIEGQSRVQLLLEGEFVCVGREASNGIQRSHGQDSRFTLRKRVSQPQARRTRRRVETSKNLELRVRMYTNKLVPD